MAEYDALKQKAQAYNADMDLFLSVPIASKEYQVAIRIARENHNFSGRPQANGNLNAPLCNVVQSGSK